LISAAAAVVIGSADLSPGRTSIDSRTTPMRMPRSDPDGLVWLAYGVARTEERGTVVYGSRGS
jgi:hypothetical protein